MIAYILTFGRLVLAAAVAAMVAAVAGEPLSVWSALGLLVLVGAEEATDLLDGYFARRQGTVSMLGGLLDPFVDSLARLAIYFAMALAGWIHLVVPLAMTLRDLTVAYTRVANSAVGAATSARRSGKIKAIVQGGAMAAVIVLAWARASLSQGALAAGRWIIASAVLAVTLWSLVDYLVGAWPAIRDIARRRPA